MAPDRILGKHPRLASYLILACALVIFGLSIWVYLLSGRVSDAEAIRRAEQRAAAARAVQSCRYLNALVEVSINIPVMNIDDILRGPLTPGERVKREDARGRYLAQLDEFKPALARCIPIIEEAGK